ITGVTPASFEPTIDYVVTKIPRFAFEKFKGSDATLGTSMKSVGEVMAIGRNFHESLQKALRGLETGLTGLDEPEELLHASKGEILAALAKRVPDRLLIAAHALRVGIVPAEVSRVSHYDPWFVERMAEIIAAERRIVADGLPARLRPLKAMGFSDARLAKLAGLSEAEVRAQRHAAGVRPVFKRIDTCAAEFESLTPYMYSTYGGTECEAEPTGATKIVILGGGPNRIGQGIEFDYCCCHAAFALGAEARGGAGYETIMVNCNPETVSTDYDTSDRLYFEPLTAEDVLELLHVEMQAGTLKGVIVQFGGQTPLKLARALEAAGIPILGTQPDAIDLAEDRERFQALVERLGLKQPAGGMARSRAEAVAVAERIGYPVLMRPSYVLGGRAMEIVETTANLEAYIETAVKVSGDSPVLIDRYLRDAIEVDVDAISDGETVLIAGVMQHIEEAGVHSGDSACSLPPHSLPADIIAEIGRQAEMLARALDVRGLMNVQFAVQDSDPGSGAGASVYLIEVNPRASRTVPFVAKAQGRAYAKIAALVMAGEKLSGFEVSPRGRSHVSVKEAVFPFARFPGADPVLSPEMKSTGEVMGIDSDFAMAFAKSQLAAGTLLPMEGRVFISVKDSDKPQILEAARGLQAMGFTLVGTRGTAEWLRAEGVAVQPINKVLEGRPHIVDAITDNQIALVFNTTEGVQSLKDSETIRSAAWARKVPIFTTASASDASVKAIAALKARPIEVKPLQDHYLD
ncbi:MAG: carbamoyl-phosphate synthase large subunit, partial [Sandaracinobacteroides sp.]